jgi:hypothetical protein
VAPIPIAQLIAQSEQLLGVERYIAVGALYGRTEPLEQAAAVAIVEAWLGSSLPDPPAPIPADSKLPLMMDEPLGDEGQVPTMVSGEAQWADPSGGGSGGSGGTVLLDEQLTTGQRQAVFDTGVVDLTGFRSVEILFDGRTEKENGASAYDNVFDPVLIQFGTGAGGTIDQTVDNYRYRSLWTYRMESSNGSPASGGAPEGTYDAGNPGHAYRKGILAGYAVGNGASAEAGRASGFQAIIPRPGDAVAHKAICDGAFLDHWDSVLNREEYLNIRGFHKVAAPITRIRLINSWAVYGWVDRQFMAPSRCVIVGH